MGESDRTLDGKSIKKWSNLEVGETGAEEEMISAPWGDDLTFAS